MDQQPLAVWLLNSEVIGASAFRLYFIFLGAKTAHPERRSHHFTRGDDRPVVLVPLAMLITPQA